MGLAIILCTLIVCDTYLFSKGWDSLFWTAKTPEEKEYQKKIREGK